MKTLSNLLSLLGIFLIMTFLMAVSCRKEKPAPKPVVPTISSFTISSTTMNSVTFNFSVSNYSSLKLSIDGRVMDISGNTFIVSGLNAGKAYTATITASNADGSVSSTQNFTTSKSNISITSFKVTDTSWNSASFAFSGASNAPITSFTLINNNTSASIDVTNKTTHSVDNLVPDSSYTFTFKVKDNTGNEVSQNVTFKTKEKASEWFSTKKVTYEYQFDIIGNAVSAKLTIETNNSASSAKTLDYLSAGFGEYGKAVKMLRYSLNGGNWVRSIASPEGVVAFTNVTFQPGDNTFESYFSLKPNVGGVPNNSPLSFSFIAMSDREGGTLPKGGSFPAAVAVGGVNASVQPTVITSNWNGYMFGNAVALPSNTIGLPGIYQSIALKANGPAPARFASIKFKNPYASFTGMVFGYQNIWKYELHDGVGKNVTSFSWQNDYVTLNLPNEAIIKTDGSNNDYYIRSYIRNSGSDLFFSGDYTPGKMGFILTSKYDLVLKNSNDQVIDLSDVVILQDGVQVN